MLRRKRKDKAGKRRECARHFSINIIKTSQVTLEGDVTGRELAGSKKETKGPLVYGLP